MVNPVAMDLLLSKSMSSVFSVVSSNKPNYPRQADAIQAIQAMDGQVINGRSMQVRSSGMYPPIHGL